MHTASRNAWNVWCESLECVDETSCSMEGHAALVAARVDWALAWWRDGGKVEGDRPVCCIMGRALGCAVVCVVLEERSIVIFRCVTFWEVRSAVRSIGFITGGRPRKRKRTQYRTL